jgi:hypothetical protein
MSECKNQKLEMIEIECACVEDSEQGMPRTDCEACQGLGYVLQPCCDEHYWDDWNEKEKIAYSKTLCPDCQHSQKEHVDSGCTHEPFCSCRNSGEYLRYGPNH